MRPFCLLAERAAVHGHVQTCLRSDLLVSLGPVPRGEIPGWKVSSCFTSPGNCQAVFPTSGLLVFPARHVGSSPAPAAVCLLTHVGSCSSFIFPGGVHVPVAQVMLDGLCIFKGPLAGRRPRPPPHSVCSCLGHGASRGRLFPLKDKDMVKYFFVIPCLMSKNTI